ncbi:TBC1 domain family member 1-like isoform X3 [Clavelina lepadiformis]
MMTSELLHPIQINSLEIKDRRPSLDEVRQRCNSTDISQIAAMKRRKGRTRHCSEPSTAASLGFDKNKTRLLQIGKQSVTLICPDLTSRNVEIHFVDIQRCCQGSKCKDHFGVFVKDRHHHHSSIQDEFKFKCFLFKCADDNVCDEIMLALRQACHTCNHGPDPMKKFHSLCKRIHSTSGSSADASWVERGVTLAAKCVAEFFCDADQKRAKQRIEERCKEEPPKTHYEHLVIVMDIARQMFEEKQREHDIRIKQLRDSNGANVVSKKITLIKSRAKKSFTSFENFLGKGIQKMQELQQEAEHHIVSPVDKFKFTFADVPRSAPSTPVSNNTATAQAKRSRNRSGSPASFTDVSPLVGGEGSRNIALPEPIRPRSKTAEAGSIDQSSLNVRRKLQLNQDNSESVPAPSVAKTSASNMNSRSYSSPFLRRLGRLLSEVKESPEAEGDDIKTLTPSRFSLTNLFKSQVKSSAPSERAMSVKCGTRTRPNNHRNRPRVSLNPFPLIVDSSTDHTTDDSADEDDRGLFFVADHSNNNSSSKNSVHDGCASTTRADKSPQIARRRDSAFREVYSGSTSFCPLNAGLPHPLDGSREAPASTKCHLHHHNPEFSDIFGNEKFFMGSVSKLDCRNLRISTESTPAQSRSSTPVLKDLSPHLRGHSTGKKLTIHQEMFYKIGTPRKRKGSKTFDSPSLSEYLKPTSIINTPEAVRLAWRRAIQDQIILNRINRISSSSELDGSSANVPANMKLDYPEPDICPPAMNDVWIELLETDERNQYKIDQSVLHAAVRKGVPRALRGRVWSMLYEQWKLRLESTQRPLTSTCKLVKTPYHELLKLLTSEQHAILIDLGRTFPTYPYYSQQLGNGQLALFNVLKAYSLADVDVGYCQGLSFVAGLLLMHMQSSNEAFSMLCHLMAGMGCRKLYLPDMEALRVAVYQLSRLLHDFHKDLYDHLEKNDVTMMLFAAPWFLTMFASVLSFGFTARIFDLLFLEGTSALFKAALCLLSHHKKNILEEDGFESVVGYLKDKLPDMDDSSVKQVLSEIFDLNIEEKLRVYEVEYSVLEEGELFGFDESDGSPQDDAKDLRQKYDRLEQVHQTVTKFNVELVEQLEAARMQISSLQQGLTDMATMDEKRTLVLQSLKQENESLKERQKV